MDNTIPGFRIKKIRVGKGLSQEELASAAGIDLRTVQRIENDETTPRMHTLRQLASALGTTIHELRRQEMRESKSLLQAMNISAIIGLFVPVLGILMSVILWIKQRDKIIGVDVLGKKVLNYCFTLFLIGVLTGIGFFVSLIMEFRAGYLVVILFITFVIYPLTLVIVVINSFLIASNRSAFFPAIRFLK